MRIPTYLSNSALSLFEKNPEEFHLKYISERRPPRIPQERPAAAGSAFDAYVKARLSKDLFGTVDPKYSLEALFEAQVEPQNRDWAINEGGYIFSCYEVSGFYDSILRELQASSEPPRFEFTVEATLNGVPYLGKPDARWVTPGFVKVVHDWKVSGYCSKSTTSPHKSYQLCRDASLGKQSKSHNAEHKEFLAYQHGDMTINTTYMEAANPAWADQLSLYGWALGEKIGDENVVLSIHQIVSALLEDRNHGPNRNGVAVEDKFIGALENVLAFYRSLTGETDRAVELLQNADQYRRDRWADAIVCGHTHEAGRIGDWYFNSGCWCRDRNTFVCIDDVGASVHEWQQDRPIAFHKELR